MKYAVNIGGRDYAIVRKSVAPLGFIYYVFDSKTYDDCYKEINESVYPRSLLDTAQAVVVVEYDYAEFKSIKIMKNRFQRSETKELLQEIL